MSSLSLSIFLRESVSGKKAFKLFYVSKYLVSVEMVFLVHRHFRDYEVLSQHQLLRRIDKIGNKV
jgi:hypothetical protein